eukprot:GDKI01025941.1.p1 GENE.GDKI01025941.1~~GDKI01025941.1.p1  ORF type:complete len:504 (+),score=132.38 GDKI01025941.1:70-1581(+)
MQQPLLSAPRTQLITRTRALIALGVGLLFLFVLFLWGGSSKQQDNTPKLVGTIPAEYCKDAWRADYSSKTAPPLEKRGEIEQKLFNCFTKSRFGMEGTNKKVDYRVLHLGMPTDAFQWFVVTNELLPEGSIGRRRAVKCSWKQYSNPRNEICIMHRLNGNTTGEATPITAAVHDAWQCSVLMPLTNGKSKPEDVTCIEVELVEGGGNAINTHLLDAVVKKNDDKSRATALRLEREAIGLMADAIDRGVLWNVIRAPHVGEVKREGETQTHAVLLDYEISSMCNNTVPWFLRHVALSHLVYQWKLQTQLMTTREKEELEPLLIDLKQQVGGIVEVHADAPNANRPGWPALDAVALDESVHAGVVEALQVELDTMVNIRQYKGYLVRTLFEDVLPINGAVLHTMESAEVVVNVPMVMGNGKDAKPVVKSWSIKGQGYVWARSGVEAAKELETIKKTECTWPEHVFDLSAMSNYHTDRTSKQDYLMNTIKNFDGSETLTFTFNKKK